MRHQAYELKQYQSLSLDAKIRMSEQRIKQWYEHYDGHVYVSFSGGKDSTVLLHLVRSLYPDVPAVFSDTGLEYPEIRRFAMAQENVLVVRPKMRFPEVIRTYGYPIISKEVAEAIHFARRIGGGEQSPEKWTSLWETDSSKANGDTLIRTSHARNRRTILQGRWQSPPGRYKCLCWAVTV